jgi:putative NIF3 family GTP cyclohydrolase 1 type 2
MTGQELIERIQKNVGVPWQSQRPDGFADGIHLGKPETAVTGIVATYAATVDVMKRAVASGKNTIICREMPFFSHGERLPTAYRNAPAPSKDVIDKDPVCRFKQEFISQNNLLIIRFVDNWDARITNGQLRGLARALSWDQFSTNKNSEYAASTAFYQLPQTSLGALARNISEKLKIHGARVIGDSKSIVHKVALTYGLLLVPDAERILRVPETDVVVAGDAVEWEAGPYFQDLVSAGKAKGLVLVGSEASEEPGCGEMAAWLKTFVTEVPVEWIPAGEPFWTLRTA